MYFTTGINVVYAICSRHDYETSVFPYLLFFLIFQAVENEVSFDSSTQKSHCLYPLLNDDEPAAPVVAVLEYNLFYNVSHVEKGRQLNVSSRVRTPSSGHPLCVSSRQGELISGDTGLTQQRAFVQ
jgi:hypothetical protein